MMLGIPAILFLVAFGALRSAELSLERQVEQERTQLFAMGIDVIHFDPSGDAAEDYDRIAKNIKKGATNEMVLDELGRIAHKPYADLSAGIVIPSMSDRDSRTTRAIVCDWIDQASTEWAQERNWKNLDRLFAFDVRFRRQDVLGHGRYDTFSNASSFPMAWSGGHVPLARLSRGERDVRGWLRRKLESSTFRERWVEDLSCFGTGSLPSNRRFSSFHFGSLVTKEGWRTLQHRQKIFQLAADLALLRQLRVIAKELLQKHSRERLPIPVRETLVKRLRSSGSDPGIWAAETVIELPLFSDFNRPYSALVLIEIDLRDSRELGRPLVPTWSMKYCTNTNGDGPIKVQANKDRFTIETENFEITSIW